MKYRRMPIEMESPEQLGYDKIRCNLAESSLTDVNWRDIGFNVSELPLAYTDHYGKPELRELIARGYDGIRPDEILLVPGAAAALFIIATSLLEKKDHLLVQFPNYATNLETPFAIGCEIGKIESHFDEGYAIGLDVFEKMCRPNTKLISITNPHNPSGRMCGQNIYDKLTGIAAKNGIYLLVDETYRELVFNGKQLPLAASFSDHVISVSSVSKAYGLPGLRIGWIVTKDKKLMETFLAAKEQIFITNSILDEEAVYYYLHNRQEMILDSHAEARRKFSMVKKWMEANEFFEWNVPEGGVVGFLRFKKNLKPDVALFYKELNDKHGTFVGPGHWFGVEDRYFRLGFGYPSEEELQEGLTAINAAAHAAIQKRS
ncbi:MAG TPA: pyridoxal phosphate-dependent aminotransferase [Bacteroidia bacterium]|nr:pyridoxal phosphate-dependent aminotransferase [Bacteroidia bacterium]